MEGKLKRFGYLLAIGVSACAPIPKSSPPPVAEKPIAQVVPVQTPPKPPQYTKWIDAPQTSGDWQYTATPPSSFAMFGVPGGNIELMLRCDIDTKKMSIARAGTASNPRVKILTETAERSLAAVQTNAPSTLIVAEISAQDPLLDAIALSYGRFAVEVSGQPTLYLPSWAEVSRVIEDCR